MIAKSLLAFFVIASALFAEPEAKAFKAEGGTEVLYRFASPEKTEEGKTYPLVLFLHGAGERGADNKAQLKHGVNDILKGAADLGEPIFLIAPQCPQRGWWANADGKDSLPLAVLELVGELSKTYPVDPKRMYLTGLSMGGFGTFAMLELSPDTWAAAIPICGAGDPTSVETFKRVPIRIFHGDADTTVPPASSKNMAEALKKAGADVELTMYPGVGHDSWTRTYRDPEVMKWLFAQRKPD